MLGSYAGYSTTGPDNAFLGSQSGMLNTTGSSNVFLGVNAGYSNTTGSYNVFVGRSAGNSNKTGIKNVFLGFTAGFSETGSDKLYIENSNVDSTSTLIWGDFNLDLLRLNAKVGIGLTPVANDLEVEGEASKTIAGDWLANSDKRIKTNIRDINNALEIVEKLHPVKFNYTNEYIKNHKGIKNIDYYNFIAQEYQEIFPESVKGSGEYLEGDENEILQLDSYNAQIVTIKAVQELILENKEQQKLIENQQNQIDELKGMISEMEAKITSSR